MFVGCWRKVSPAGAVDLSAISWLGGSGSRVVSMAKGTNTRWKAESGRSDNSSRVNAVDSAGTNLARVILAKWSWTRTLAGRFGGSADQKPRNFLLRAWTWIWVTSRPPAEVVREREGSRRREDQGALRRAGAELGSDHRGDTHGVKRSLAGGSAGACEEAGSMARGSRDALA